MEPDKRRFVRKRTDQLLYAEFGPDNGSILLNLCEDGCSFQSMAPVRDQQLRFSVSIGDGRKLEGDGQMVWSDTARKTGGLRFLNPSRELRERVREWLEETLVTADGKLDPAAVESKAKRQAERRQQEARAEAALAWNEGVLKESETKPHAHVAITTSSVTKSAVARLMSEVRPTRESSTWSPIDAIPRGTWRGVGAIALGAVLLATVVGYRRELGHVVMFFGSSIAGDEQKPSVVAAPATVPNAVTTNPDSDTGIAKRAAMIDRDSPEQTSTESAATGTGEISRATDAPTGVVKHSSPQQGSSQQLAGKDVPALWSSVEGGDTRAEVTLANRYIHGEDVPQSCAQARVLLEAAAKRGSSEAKQRLDELPQAGCP
jgi:hypothetical protein